MPVLQVAPSSGQNWLSSSSHGAPLSGASIIISGAIFRTKTGYHHHMVGPLSGAMPVLQVAPSSGQNWLSSSSHGGATERCQYYNKWRHLPDKTGYRHHHMVAPLSGASSSSGAIFRTKTGYHHHHMVAPLRGAERDRADTQGTQKKGDKRAEKRRIKDICRGTQKDAERHKEPHRVVKGEKTDAKMQRHHTRYTQRGAQRRREPYRHSE